MSDELDGMWERYVALRVEHTCKEISEGVYEHTFTPRSDYRAMESSGMLSGDEVAALLDWLCDHEPYTPVPTRELADAGVFLLTRSMAHRIRALSAKAQRYVRARKRERRQHRAAFRRRKRGLA